MSRWSARTSRVRPVAVALTLASLALAGGLAQVRDQNISNDVQRTSIGKAAPVAGGQTLTASAIEGGTFYDGTTSSSRDMTHGRFLVVTVRATTDTRRRIGLMVCELHTDRGGVVHTVDYNPISMPDPGFRLTQRLLFEVADEDVEGLSMSCRESSPLLYRESEVIIDLGLRGPRLTEFMTSTAHREVKFEDDLVEVDE